MVGWVKYGLDCWMMDGDGKWSAEAEARGLPDGQETNKPQQTNMEGTEGEVC